MVLFLIRSAIDFDQRIVWGSTGFLFLVTAGALIPLTKRLSHHSVWTHYHFPSATLAQFFYVAAQAGIFSFFINSMTPDPKTGFTMVPPIPTSWNQAMTNVSTAIKHFADMLPHWIAWLIQWMPGWLLGWFETDKNGLLRISDKGGSNLASVGFIWFLAGRFTGAGLLRKVSAHKLLGLYSVMNVLACSSSSSISVGFL